MSIRRIKLLGLLVLFVAVAAANSAALAQQTTGTPGSPGATTTIDGRYLPAPPPKFGDEMNLNALQSKPWWPPRVVPPKGAPNILLILTDDVGFAAPSTFGGANPDLLRRYEERHGDLVARADQGEGWYALAVPPRH